MMKFWLRRVNKGAILLYFVLFLAIFLEEIDNFFLNFLDFQTFFLFLHSFFKTLLIGQGSLILLHKCSLFLHLLLGLVDKSMRVCFKIIAVFVPYIRNSWYGA